MKIGLLTSIREDHDLPGENFFKRYMSNLAPMYLAGYLQKAGLPVEILIKDRLEDLIPHVPDILGISSVTENFEFAKCLASRAKQLWNPIIVLGGVHITALPHTLPAMFDVGVVGEGEETFRELVQLILKTGELPSSDRLASIPGLVFHDAGQVRASAKRPNFDRLDDIPIPDRRHFLKNIGTAYMMTSRGCPYTCSFCVIPSVTEGYRKHSVDYVLEEIKAIKENFPEVRHIRIFDDLYIVDRKRVREIALRVEAEGLNQELSFGCWGRANLIDREMIDTFQRMNMLYVAFGAESGSSRVLSQIKPGASIEDNQEAIDRLVDGGVRASCSVILGHPKETEEDLAATYEFIERNMDRLLEIEFNVAIPWPGTDLWRDALKRGLVREDMDFNQLKECGYFPNYCTALFPYLNTEIPPERFDQILVDFKKLYRKMMNKINELNLRSEVNPLAQISMLQ